MLSVKLVSIPILVDRGRQVGVWRAFVSSDGALPYAFTELESSSIAVPAIKIIQ